eukprot:4288-Heterococcus_DN1.PRE.1
MLMKLSGKRASLQESVQSTTVDVAAVCEDVKTEYYHHCHAAVPLVALLHYKTTVRCNVAVHDGQVFISAVDISALAAVSSTAVIGNSDGGSSTVDVVKLLLAKGTHVNAQCAQGCTPLMLTAQLPVLKLLLAAGADVSIVDSTGSTVLHALAKAGAGAGAICLMIKHGADATLCDSNGSTAAHIAGISGHFAAEALLSRAAADYSAKHSSVKAATDTTITSNSSSSSSASTATISSKSTDTAPTAAA